MSKETSLPNNLPLHEQQTKNDHVVTVVDRMILASLFAVMLQNVITSTRPILMAVLMIAPAAATHVIGKFLYSSDTHRIRMTSYKTISSTLGKPYDEKDEFFVIITSLVTIACYYIRALFVTEHSYFEALAAYSLGAGALVFKNMLLKHCFSLSILGSLIFRYYLHLQDQMPLMRYLSLVWPVLVAATALNTATYHARFNWTSIKHINEELKMANETKNAFLSTISHEIRTPLHIIIGCGDLLLNMRNEKSPRDDHTTIDSSILIREAKKRSSTSNLPLASKIQHAPLTPSSPHLESSSSEEHISLIQTIILSGNVLLETLNSILNFTKIEQLRDGLSIIPNDQLEFQQFDLIELIQEVTQVVRVKGMEKSLKVFHEIDSSIDFQFVVGDKVRIREIMLNLMFNACKFTSKGSVSLHIRRLGTAGTLEIEVRDTGIGIPEAFKANIFKPFTQADAGLKRKYGGTGLGLAIAKGLSELMGGNIYYKSKVGEGTSFFCTITVDIVDTASAKTREDLSTPSSLSPATPISQAMPLKATSSAASARIRVLVVDDNEVNLKVLAKMLSLLKVSFDTATSGEMAISKLEKEQFNVVFMDVEMPGMSGLEAVNIIRKSGNHDVMIYFLTGSERTALCTKSVSQADGFLQKPLRMESLRKILQEAQSKLASQHKPSLQGSSATSSVR